MNKRKQKPSPEACLYIIGCVFFSLVICLEVIKKVFHINIIRKMPPCFFHAYTGYYCPGCGGTRATQYLIHGHIIKSFIYHPLVPYLGIGGMLFMISHTIAFFSKGKIKGIKYHDFYVILMAVIIIVQFLVKNALIYFFHIYLLK